MFCLRFGVLRCIQLSLEILGAFVGHILCLAFLAWGLELELYTVLGFSKLSTARGKVGKSGLGFKIEEAKLPEIRSCCSEI